MNFLLDKLSNFLLDELQALSSILSSPVNILYLVTSF